MRSQKVIAIYGATASGKTTVARAVAGLLGCKSLHCGERVRARAAQLGVSPASLPDADHAAIDEETRALVRAGEYGVVEGSFLDVVLDSSTQIVLVRVECADPERLERYFARDPGASADMAQRDASDASFRARYYHNGSREPMIVLNTTARSIIESARELVSSIDALTKD